MSGRAILPISVLSFIWGTTYIATKFAIQEIPVFLMVGLREFVAGLILLVIAFLKEDMKSIRPKELIITTVFGLGYFTGARGLMTISLAYIPAGITALIYSLIPIYVIILNLFNPRIYLNQRIIIGIIFGLFGMLIVFQDSLSSDLRYANIIGLLLALIGAFSWASTSLIAKNFQQKNPIAIRVSMQLLLGGAGLLILSYLSGETLPEKMPGWVSLISIFYLIVFGSIVGFLVFSHAIREYPVAQISVYAYINPLVAAVLGYTLLQESYDIFLLLSFIITLYGVYLVNSGYREQFIDS